jgi:hypothetical protein
LKKSNNKKIKIKPVRDESFETTLERYGQGRLFKIDHNLNNVKNKQENAGYISFKNALYS